MRRYLNLIRYVRNWWAYFPAKWRKGEQTLYFTCRNGVRVEVPRRLRNTFKEVFFKDAYGGHLMADLPPRSVVLDVGAKVGYFSLYIFTRFPAARVVAYEPMPVNLPLLQRHAQLNPAAEWTICPEAVYGVSGTLRLAYNADDTFTTDASVRDHREANAHLEVPTRSLPDILAAHRLTHCDLLKLDCEGAEYDILYRCPDECWPRLHRMALEVHPGPGPDENLPALQHFLEQKGFRTRAFANDILWAWRTDGRLL